MLIVEEVYSSINCSFIYLFIFWTNEVIHRLASTRRSSCLSLLLLLLRIRIEERILTAKIAHFTFKSCFLLLFSVCHCFCFLVTFWMNTSLLFTGSLNEASVGGNNLHVWGKICHVGIHVIFLSAWIYTLGCLFLCLSDLFFLPLCKMSSVSTCADTSSHAGETAGVETCFYLTEQGCSQIFWGAVVQTKKKKNGGGGLLI